MTIEQTVEIPASHRLVIDVPPEVPVGQTRVIIQFPASTRAAETGGYSPEWQETLAAIKRAQGAWVDKPWENCIEDIRAMRDERIGIRCFFAF